MLWAYNTLLPVARAGARLAAARRSKLRAGLAGRRGVGARLAAFGAAHAGRTVWFHSTSVGEYEQARPITSLLRARHPDLAILHTFFSPSGFEYAKRLGEAEHFDYLPEDTPAAMAAVLDAVRPLVLVFMKFDLWPNAIAAARRRSIPVLLFDATLRPRSWRSRWPARALYREIYAQIDLISAVSEADAGRFRALVPLHPAIVVDGDSRSDQVVRRRRAAQRTSIAPALRTEPRPWTLVAGSTWGPDEALLVPAWHDAAGGDPASRLVLVPHEPTAAHLVPLERALAAAGFKSCRYSELETIGMDTPGVILVDRVGILAELYEMGTVAYVGGAFTTGVHNVLEPAIMGLPVLFGPRHHNAPEAARLLDANAGTVVRSRADLGAALIALRADADACRAAGQRARAVVEADLGASERCVQHLERYLGR